MAVDDSDEELVRVGEDEAMLSAVGSVDISVAAVLEPCVVAVCNAGSACADG